jgi:hypothetical protein
MKRFLTFTLVGALLLCVSSITYANVCAFDPVPAASLLFPFVAYDYSGNTATNTLFAITNVSSEAQIVHVTIWSDYSFPVLDFNIVLSGYDVQTINLRDILANGDLPITGTWTPLIVAGTQPIYDGPVSHQDGLWLDGILPPPEDTYALYLRCPPTGSAYPGNYAVGLDSDDLDTLQFYFTAVQASTKWHNDCLGTSYTLTPPDWWELRDLTMVTWMYITADVVWECNRLFPDQPVYWTDQVLYDNVLMGDVFWVDDVANFSEADNAVHLEADLQIGNVATLDGLGNPITFYYRYSTRNLVTPTTVSRCRPRGPSATSVLVLPVWTPISVPSRLRPSSAPLRISTSRVASPAPTSPTTAGPTLTGPGTRTRTFRPWTRTRGRFLV